MRRFNQTLLPGRKNSVGNNNVHPDRLILLMRPDFDLPIAAVSSYNICRWMKVQSCSLFR
jgi:hypothetical protein